VQPFCLGSLNKKEKTRSGGTLWSYCPGNLVEGEVAPLRGEREVMRVRGAVSGMVGWEKRGTSTEIADDQGGILLELAGKREEAAGNLVRKKKRKGGYNAYSHCGQDIWVAIKDLLKWI